jgi:hypothetical protein
MKKYMRVPYCRPAPLWNGEADAMLQLHRSTLVIHKAVIPAYFRTPTQPVDVGRTATSDDE